MAFQSCCLDFSREETSVPTLEVPKPLQDTPPPIDVVSCLCCFMAHFEFGLENCLNLLFVKHHFYGLQYIENTQQVITH